MLKRETIAKVIGKTFADKLDEEIISISKDLSYSRRAMVEELGCANFNAAARLNKVLKRLKIYTAKQLWELDPFSLARSKGIGETSLFVAMCILDSRKYSVEKWWGWNDNVVKFSTFKHQAIKRSVNRKQEVA